MLLHMFVQKLVFNIFANYSLIPLLWATAVVTHSGGRTSMIAYLPHLEGVPMTLTKAIVDSLVTLSRLEVPRQEEVEGRRRTRRLSRRHA
jgi:hypothetical protein